MKIVQKDGKFFVVGKVKIGETEHDVEQEVTTDSTINVLTADQLKDGFISKKSLGRRLDAAKAAERARLLQDEEFKTEAVTAWNLGGGEGDDKNKDEAGFVRRLAAERKKWEDTALKPVQTELETVKGKVASLQKTTLTSEIVAAASRYGVAEDLLKPVGPNKTPLIINMVSPFFDQDPKTERWLVREGDDFAYSPNPKGEDVYIGVDEFMNNWAKENSALAPGYTQKGPGAGDPARSGPVDKKAEIARLESEGKFGAANALKAELLQAPVT